jgi:hypothetical protein
MVTKGLEKLVALGILGLQFTIVAAPLAIVVFTFGDLPRRVP